MDWYCENIIYGDLEVEKVYESQRLIAFHHTKPFYEHHVVVIPKHHVNSLVEPESVEPALAAEIMKVLRELAKEFSEQWGGCHIGTNVGTYQSTPHLHWYIHAGKRIRDRKGNLIENTMMIS